MNPSLIESELFGHERGAFTGADQSRRGVFDLAGSGTILLDEIGDLPLAQQVKLLRVLEQREFLPVGSSKPREVKARVIAATHRDLLPMVAEGSFREDLYFRLAVFTIEMPSLRQRQEDIIPLAIRFLQRYAYPNDRSVLSGEAIDLLEAYPWPGNVRELRNAMDHAAVLARGNRIHAEHLPHFPSKKLDDFDSPNGSLASHFDQLIRQWVSQQELKSNHEALSPDVLLGDSDAIADAPDSQSLYNAFLRVVEPPLLRAMLDSNQGNRAAVAKKLGLHRSTLRQKMRYHEMET
jgi:two-component system nitrogen regulation response regulator GlnG